METNITAALIILAFFAYKIITDKDKSSSNNINLIWRK